MEHTGKALATDSIAPNIDLEDVGSRFNDLFRAAHDAAIQVGLDLCDEMTFTTPTGLIVMSCSGINTPIHFHILVILDKDGNQALVKLELDELNPVFKNHLS